MCASVCLCVWVPYIHIRPKICRVSCGGMFLSSHTPGKPAEDWGDWLTDKCVRQGPVRKIENTSSVSNGGNLM